MNRKRQSFEIVIVGAGPAGIAAACAATGDNRSVAIVDDTPWLGGQIWRGQQAKPSNRQAASWLLRLHASGATIIDRTSVVAAPTKGVLLAERDGEAIELHWEKLILATGARELFLPFPGWTLPGIMGPGGIQALVKNGWPIKGQRVLIAGSGPLLLAVANGLRNYGARIISVSEQASFGQVCRFAKSLAAHPLKLLEAAALKIRLLGIPCRYGTWPIRAEGDSHVRRVTFASGDKAWSEECDLFACGFGLLPNTELALSIGCKLREEFVVVDQSQRTTVENVFCAGEPTGIGGADCALIEGQIAGYAATGQMGRAESLLPERALWHRFREQLASAFQPRAELKRLATDETIVCRCEDVSMGRMCQFSNWRDAKLQSRCGMGPCQGRICGPAARILFGWGMESVRPPVLPARVSSLVSQQSARL